jgi:hypothetical protein
VLRDRDEAVFVERHVLRQHAVDGAAQRRRKVFRLEPPVQPLLKENGGDAVAYVEARDLGAGGHDFAGAIGEWHEIRLHGAGIAAELDVDIPAVQRHGVHAYQHFVLTRLAHRRFHQLENRRRVTGLLQLVLALGSLSLRGHGQTQQ